jgi:hypothetical protein
MLGAQFLLKIRLWFDPAQRSILPNDFELVATESFLWYRGRDFIMVQLAATYYYLGNY